jgi:hypothetical protein
MRIAHACCSWCAMSPVTASKKRCVLQHSCAIERIHVHGKNCQWTPLTVDMLAVFKRDTAHVSAVKCTYIGCCCCFVVCVTLGFMARMLTEALPRQQHCKCIKPYGVLYACTLFRQWVECRGALARGFDMRAAPVLLQHYLRNLRAAPSVSGTTVFLL